MQLDPWRPVLEHDGPLLTVYLESQSPTEDAAAQVRKRWESLRRSAEDDGADEGALDAVENALEAHKAGEIQVDGRVLVATPTDGDHAGSVLLEEPWSAVSTGRDSVQWATLPDVGALVREELRAVRVLVAVADQHGARVRLEVLSPENDPEAVESTLVEGESDREVHKPRQGALAHNRIQRRADEAVKENAQTVAKHLSSAVNRYAPAVLVLAGEVQARTAIRQELGKREADLCVETDRGGVEDEGAEQALAAEVRRIATETVADAQTEYSEQLHQQTAQGLGIQGADAVAAAAEMGAVAAMLLEADRPANREGLLLQACAVTDTAVGLVDTQTRLDDGVGALLRFPLPGGPQQSA
ncbi:MAG: hypothetical protein L0H31_08285 [Nocardioidaceae bacterium]|nr:hypothetical protein [Nocardioidaceae bacterium]